MTQHLDYVAAGPGQVYWRFERCPHVGAKVLLLTIGGVCITGPWHGELGEFYQAWSPMPKRGRPPADIREAPLLERMRFAWNLIFNPRRRRQQGEP
jgi:hypothetical protein